MPDIDLRAAIADMDRRNERLAFGRGLCTAYRIALDADGGIKDAWTKTIGPFVDELIGEVPNAC